LKWCKVEHGKANKMLILKFTVKRNPRKKQKKNKKWSYRLARLAVNLVCSVGKTDWRLSVWKQASTVSCLLQFPLSSLQLLPRLCRLPYYSLQTLFPLRIPTSIFALSVKDKRTFYQYAHLTAKASPPSSLPLHVHLPLSLAHVTSFPYQ